MDQNGMAQNRRPLLGGDRLTYENDQQAEEGQMKLYNFFCWHNSLHFSVSVLTCSSVTNTQSPASSYVTVSHPQFNIVPLCSGYWTGINTIILKSGVQSWQMVWSGFCALPVWVQRSCWPGSEKGATHSSVWWVMSEQWCCICRRSGESPQSWLEARDLFSVNLRAGDVPSESRSEIYQKVSRDPRGNPLSWVSLGVKRTGVVFSGGKRCHSIWLVQRHSVVFYLGKIHCGDTCSCFILFSGHFLLTYEQFSFQTSNQFYLELIKKLFKGDRYYIFS